MAKPFMQQRISETTCKGCGSLFEITKTKLIVRDKDEIKCEVCGEELIRWNSSHTYDAKLLKKAEKIK